MKIDWGKHMERATRSSLEKEQRKLLSDKRKLERVMSTETNEACMAVWLRHMQFINAGLYRVNKSLERIRKNQYIKYA